MQHDANADELEINAAAAFLFFFLVFVPIIIISGDILSFYLCTSIVDFGLPS